MSSNETLSSIASRCCKHVYIGTAVLPKPLFLLDPSIDFVDDDHDDNDNNNTKAARSEEIKCATISTVGRNQIPHDTTTEDNNNSTATNKLSRYAQTVISEFNSIVIEHHLKWSPLVHTLPGPISESSPPTLHLGKYDFSHVDAMVDFAIRHNLHIKGHVLVWHVTSPPFLEEMSSIQVKEAVKRHIFTTMNYFKGRITMWDVVNEALASDGTLVENVFYRKMGPDYIEQCFRWAHEANNEAFLIYNDNKVEGCGAVAGDGDGNNRHSKAPIQAKADGFYNLLKDLVSKGVPIHGAGMQAHFSAGGTMHQRPPTPAMVKRQIRRIGELGLKVNISEMDVRVSKLPTNSSLAFDNDMKSAAQTQIYQDILSAALSEPSFDGIWLWGFSDRHTWVKNFYYDDAPLIFDEKYQKKESYVGVQKALQTLCPGGRVGEMIGGDNAQCYLEQDVDSDGKTWGKSWMQPEPEEVGNRDKGDDATKEGQPDWLLHDVH